MVADVEHCAAGSNPMLCVADNGDKYWVKFANNPQGAQTLVPEVVVPALARLLDAPVLQPAFLAVDDALVGIPYSPDELKRIPPGLAHGSPLVESVGAREDELTHAQRDGNAQRIPALLVLWDWAMGEDPQWLYDEHEHGTIWSFDHGFWLDVGESHWTEESLATVSTARWTFEESIPARLDAGAFVAAADRLERVDAADIVSALSRVPRAWAPDDALLEALGWCLYTRIPGVVARAHEQAGRASRGGQR